MDAEAGPVHGTCWLGGCFGGEGGIDGKRGFGETRDCT